MHFVSYISSFTHYRIHRFLFFKIRVYNNFIAGYFQLVVFFPYYLNDVSETWLNNNALITVNIKL